MSRRQQPEQMSDGKSVWRAQSPRTYVKRLLSPRYLEAYRTGRRVVQGLPVWPPATLYEDLYERHTLMSTDSDAVGLGSFDTIGVAELAVLRHEGLQPTHTLIDFGCGTGRLAIHAIPALPHGCYIGIDISQEMLRRLGRHLEMLGSHGCTVSLLHQRTESFPLGDSTADMLCAFSVFTHMEHEDTYGYLRQARRVVRPGGRLIFSCLPIDSRLGRDIFLDSASTDVQGRWSNVRNVTTSRDLMHEIARLAGWTMTRWYPGDEDVFTVPGRDAPQPFGQAVGVLE